MPLPLRVDGDARGLRPTFQDLLRLVDALPPSAWARSPRRCIKRNPADVVWSLNLGSTVYHHRTFLAAATGKHRGIIESVHCIMAASHPGFRFHSISILSNYASAEHVDAGDTGLAAAFALGDFTGGELGGRGWLLDIRHKPTLFCATEPHFAMPFVGRRVVMVCYTRREAFSTAWNISEWAGLVREGFQCWQNLESCLRFFEDHGCAVNMPEEHLFPEAKEAKLRHEALDFLLFSYKDLTEWKEQLRESPLVEELLRVLDRLQARSIGLVQRIESGSEWLADNSVVLALGVFMAEQADMRALVSRLLRRQGR